MLLIYFKIYFINPTYITMNFENLIVMTNIFYMYLIKNYQKLIPLGWIFILFIIE